jgi:hypothetical protein
MKMNPENYDAKKHNKSENKKLKNKKLRSNVTILISLILIFKLNVIEINSFLKVSKGEKFGSPVAVLIDEKLHIYPDFGHTWIEIGSPLNFIPPTTISIWPKDALTMNGHLEKKYSKDKEYQSVKNYTTTIWKIVRLIIILNNKCTSYGFLQNQCICTDINLLTDAVIKNQEPKTPHHFPSNLKKEIFEN